MENISNNCVLKTTALSKTYKKNILALDGLSLEIKEGQCVALLGPNGAGKTTACEIITGLETPDKGTLSIHNLNYKTNRNKILEKIGVQMQETQLYKRYTVFETLKLFSSLYEKKINIDDLIRDLKLEEKRDEQLKNLSGGQKQRLYIGCALINDPSILILDEPTSNLDPQSKHAIWHILEQKMSEKKSILLTTHDMNEAQRIADQILILNEGKLIAKGSANELIENICGKKYLSFYLTLKEKDLYKKITERLPWITNANAQKFYYSVTTNKPQKYIKDLYTHSKDLNYQVHSLEVRETNLEDVFLKITGRNIRDH